MSDQANLLGHPGEAVKLAKAGQHAIKADDSAACLADLCVLEARAQAALGNDRRAVQAVAEAERLFQRVERDEEQEWARFIDQAYMYGEAAHTFRDLAFRDPKKARHAEEFATVSLDEARRQGRARRGALSYAARAISHLQRKDVDRAGHEAVRVLDLAGQVTSSRTRETIRDLRRRFRGHETVPGIAEFVERARSEFSVAA